MGQPKPTINPNPFGADLAAVRSQPPLQVRSIPEIVEAMLRRAGTGLLLELREAYQQGVEDKPPRGLFVPDVVVWKTIAQHLGLPESLEHWEESHR